MRKLMLVAVALGALAGGAASLHAQDENITNTLPKVLVIDHEMVKFGKDAAHEKNEAAFARAFEAAKSPEHYLAATTLSGGDEAVFFVGYDSFAAWGEDQKASNEPKMQAMLAPLQEKDGDYVSDGHQLVATLNDKWSYQAQAVDIGKQHYIEVETVRLRPGHDKDWQDLIDLYKAALTKMSLDESDVFYEVKYGAPEGTVLIFTPRASMADIDTTIGNDKAFQEALGEDGQKKWSQLLTASVESGRIDLLAVDPEMSYPMESWVKADPDFWKPKPAVKAALKAPAKAPAKEPAGDK
jgi:hypothetical protein